MSDELLRLILTAFPTGGLLLFTARYVWRIQAVISARFEHVLQSLRADIVDLERANERLENQLTLVRDARRADNFRCDEKIAELQRQLRQLTPPFGNPTKDTP